MELKALARFCRGRGASAENIQLSEEKMPPKDPAAGQSRSQGVNLYIKNLVLTSECQT